jgi:mannitol-specific phosphotransferase system IIBC component
LDTSAPTTSTPKGKGTELMIGLVAAFIISFIVMIILWAIGRASRSKN